MAEAKFHIVEHKEPAYSVSPRNPAGDILTIRTPLVVTVKNDGTLDAAQTAKDTYDLFKVMVAEVVGAVWTDSPEVYLASFDPAVAHAMATGASVEDALDLKEADKRQTAAFERLKGGPRSSGGGRSGSSGKTPIDLSDLPDAVYDDLPKDFINELRNGTQCPDCRSEKFWDNRDDPERGKGPKMACANKDCEGGGKKQNGGYFPWAWFGGEKKDGGGGGGRRRGRGD